MQMIEILQKAVELKSSDIHIVIGKPPMARILGEIVPLEGFPVIKPEDSKQLIYSILFDKQKSDFEEKLELDCSAMVPNLSRFRINVFMQKNGIEAVLRVVPSIIPTPEQIDMPQSIVELTNLTKGLILVTGPTGSGKSTALACLINIINKTRKCNIITIEDPIEFVYEHANSVVRQREIGQHTRSFTNALKSSLREDPDVILIGEMRDLETISSALTIAETGHLVFGTLHTNDAAQTVDRIINVFPSHQQQQIRVLLASTLRSVISQILIPRVDVMGRAAVREIMIVTPAISNLIREGKTHQIYTAIETGSKLGMISLDKALLDMVKKGFISIEDAIAKASNPDTMRTAVGARQSTGAQPYSSY